MRPPSVSARRADPGSTPAILGPSGPGTAAAGRGAAAGIGRAWG